MLVEHEDGYAKIRVRGMIPHFVEFGMNPTLEISSEDESEPEAKLQGLRHVYGRISGTKHAI
jgi:hypothetical protein